MISSKACILLFLSCACRVIDDRLLLIHLLIEMAYKNDETASAMSHAAINAEYESITN